MIIMIEEYTKTRDAQCKCSALMPSQSPKQQQLPSQVFAQNDAIWYGISLWPCGFTVLAMSPPSSLCPLCQTAQNN